MKYTIFYHQGQSGETYSWDMQRWKFIDAENTQEAIKAYSAFIEGLLDCDDCSNAMGAGVVSFWSAPLGLRRANSKHWIIREDGN